MHFKRVEKITWQEWRIFLACLQLGDVYGLKLQEHKPLEKKESYYIGSNCTIIKDDDKTTAFLNKLHGSLVSDEEILRILKKRWNNTVEEGERNNKALAYSSVLCRAGIEINEALRFVSSLIPNFDCKERVEYAYKHNFFGSDRIKFVHKK